MDADRDVILSEITTFVTPFNCTTAADNPPDQNKQNYRKSTQLCDYIHTLYSRKSNMHPLSKNTVDVHKTKIFPRKQKTHILPLKQQHLR
jgi:hypothetical protein